ncbi:MAG: GNAT superfamily N-acetyltransferase [Flavobacteriales bacterium]|jgi:GNAT superfamily N-acetyltransferase
MSIKIRTALKSDMPVVLDLIKDLAIYEKEPDAVITTVKQLETDGFGENKVFDCVVAENEMGVVGFALYYTGYSTWKGKTLYLEDFLVRKDCRGLGIGKLLFQNVVDEAQRRGVKRMDWQVLEWNKLAIDFYKRNNADLDPEWLNGRLNF